MPVLVVGNTACDLVDELPRRAGGAPVYAAEALARLRHPGLIVTSAADADADLVDAVRQHGLEVVHRPSDTTATFRLRHTSGRQALTIEHLGARWTGDDVARWVTPAVDRPCWIQVGALCRADLDPSALEALAALGPVALDGQGLVRPGRSGPVVLDGDFDPGVLRHVTVLKLAEDELAAAGGERAVSELGVPELLLTFGSQGSVVCCADRAARIDTEALEPSDATGAGDRYLAAYLARRDAGDEPVAAAQAASRLVHELLLARMLAEPAR